MSSRENKVRTKLRWMGWLSLVWLAFMGFTGAVCAQVGGGEGAVVRLHGATTCIRSVIHPHKQAVERATGISLQVFGNATGPGLLDLVAGRCDIALVSEPMDIALEAATRAGAWEGQPDWRFEVLQKEEVVFVVNSGNPLNELTWEQIRDLHTGRVRNWQALGGEDLPVVVFTDAIGGGTRALARRNFLGGAEYGKDCRVLETVRMVPREVSEYRGACGVVGISFVDTKLVKIIRTEKVERPLGVVTLGEPKGDVARVLAELRRQVGGGRGR